MNGKRIIMIFIVIMALVAIAIGLIYKNSDKEKYFYGTVLEVQDGYILVSPLHSEDIYKSTDKILISTDDIYNEEDNVIVYYEGDVSETYPSTVDVTEIEVISVKVDGNDKENSVNDNINIETNDKVDKNESVNEVNTTSYTEEDVISYFDNELVEVSSYSKTSEFKDKAKNLFMSIIDFLFYDKEVRGYTFSELSNSAKLKILDIAFNIDSKIEELFPNYKDSLSSKYNSAKDMIVTKYLEITVDICSNNHEYCDKAKDVWSTIKEKAGLSWDVIKKYFGEGISNLKDWYEIYSGK